MEQEQVAENKYYPLGGHMIDPPDFCPHRKRSVDGAIWVDIAFCCRTCQLAKECSRYDSFKGMSSEERKKDLISRGVKLVNSWAKDDKHS